MFHFAANRRIKLLCLCLCAVTAFLLLTGCHHEEEPADPGKTYDFGAMKTYPVSDVETNVTVANWIASCRDNKVSSIKVFCLAYLDNTDMTADYLFYMPTAGNAVKSEVSLDTKDYRRYTMLVTFTDLEDQPAEDVIYHFHVDVIRPSLSQNNVLWNGQTGVMLTMQASGPIAPSTWSK